MPLKTSFRDKSSSTGKSYFPKSIATFLELSGCFILPIDYRNSKKLLRQKIQELNGILIMDFQGSGPEAERYL